jgi:hypothetical protein
MSRTYRCRRSKGTKFRARRSGRASGMRPACHSSADRTSRSRRSSPRSTTPTTCFGETWIFASSFLRERNALVTFQQFQRSRSPIVSGNTHGSVRFNGWRRGNGPCRGIQQSSNYATEHSAQFPEPQTTGDNGLFIPSRKTAVILGGFRQMRSGKDHPFILCQRNYCVRRLRNVAN